MLDVTGPAEVLQQADRRGHPYDLTLHSPRGGQARTSTGIPLSGTVAAAEAGRFDTVLVAGGDLLTEHPRTQNCRRRPAPWPHGPHGSLRCAPAPSSWPDSACWTSASRPPTGGTPHRTRTGGLPLTPGRTVTVHHGHHPSRTQRPAAHPDQLRPGPPGRRPRPALHGPRRGRHSPPPDPAFPRRTGHHSRPLGRANPSGPRPTTPQRHLSGPAQRIRQRRDLPPRLSPPPRYHPTVHRQRFATTGTTTTGGEDAPHPQPLTPPSSRTTAMGQDASGTVPGQQSGMAEKDAEAPALTDDPAQVTGPPTTAASQRSSHDDHGAFSATDNRQDLKPLRPSGRALTHRRAAAGDIPWSAGPGAVYRDRHGPLLP